MKHAPKNKKTVMNWKGLVLSLSVLVGVSLLIWLWPLIAFWGEIFLDLGFSSLCMNIRGIKKNQSIDFPTTSEFELVRTNYPESQTISYSFETEDPTLFAPMAQLADKYRQQAFGTCFYPYREWFPMPSGGGDMWGFSYIYDRADGSEVQINEFSNVFYDDKKTPDQPEKHQLSVTFTPGNSN